MLDLSTILGWLAVTLALFAIGLPYMSPSLISQLLRGKKPQTKEEYMIARRFLALMGVIGFYGFMVFLGFLIANITSPIANTILLKLGWLSNIWLRPLLQFIFAVLVVGIFYLFIRKAWNKAIDSVKTNPHGTTDNEKLNESVDELIIKLEQLGTSINKITDKLNESPRKQKSKHKNR